MASCYAFQGRGADDQNYCWFYCADNPNWKPHPSYPGYYQPYDGARNLAPSYQFTTPGAIIYCGNQSNMDAAAAGRTVIGAGCSGCLGNPPNQTKTYDCLNGSCVEKSQFNTPGIYKSLEECQANCGASNNECPPGHVCLTTSEFSEISSLASQIKGAVCG